MKGIIIDSIKTVPKPIPKKPIRNHNQPALPFCVAFIAIAIPIQNAKDTSDRLIGLCPAISGMTTDNKLPNKAAPTNRYVKTYGVREIILLAVVIEGFEDSALIPFFLVGTVSMLLDVTEYVLVYKLLDLGYLVTCTLQPVNNNLSFLH